MHVFVIKMDFNTLVQNSIKYSFIILFSPSTHLSRPQFTLANNFSLFILFGFPRLKMQLANNDMGFHEMHSKVWCSS